MPKKPPRNAFYFYMVDFKEEQRKKGVNYPNMAAVADAAGPLWRDAPPSVKCKFEAIAKKEKQKYNIPEQKYTSNGFTFAQIDQQAKEIQEAIEHEINDIKSLVSMKVFDNSVPKLDIYLMDVNCYCKANNDYLIGESTLLRFNITEGVMDSYHEIINPGKIPIGYTSDVKYGCQDLGLSMPNENNPRTNYMQVLANIIDYLKQQDPNTNVLPPIFTMPDKVAPVLNFIQQMCRRAGEDDSLFRVYQLDTLFFTVINAVRTRPDEGFPRETLALAQLKKDPFKYSPGIGCEHHNDSDKSVECTLSRTKRWAYTVLDSCCPVAGVEVLPGNHVPADFDLESIHVFQEQKKARHAPSVAEYSAGVSSNTSQAGDCNESTHSSVAGSKKTHKKYAPLRVPDGDYNYVHTAPELNEENFPSLSSRAGRGRGIGSSFSNLKLND